MNGFPRQSQKITPNLPDAYISYYPFFLDLTEAAKYFETFLKNLKWEQHHIKIFGKTYPQPRLTALYGENDQAYTYSNLKLQPNAFSKELIELNNRLFLLTGNKFTHCLANLYRDGNDGMGWHSDDEKELGKNPVIASISIGAERNFKLKHRTKSDLNYKLTLEHGSLLMMEGTTQHYWKHQLPKTRKPLKERINLTFRKILLPV